MNTYSNKIKQPSQCCIHCGKSYKKRTNLDKHIVICELLQISKKKKPIPSLVVFMKYDDRGHG